MVANAGEVGKMPSSCSSNCPRVAAYERYARELKVDNVVIMDDQRGMNGLLNRGPEAFVDFLHRFEDGFGISVKELLTRSGRHRIVPVRR